MHNLHVDGLRPEALHMNAVERYTKKLKKGTRISDKITVNDNKIFDALVQYDTG